MSLAIFDLDNTLLSIDSDHAWGEFLVEQGAVDPVAYREANERFLADYNAGTLDMMAFLALALKPLADNSPEQLAAQAPDALLVLPWNLIEELRQQLPGHEFVTAIPRLQSWGGHN